MHMKKRTIATGDCKNGDWMLKDILDKKTEIQKHLFEKGFLITDADIKQTEFPFSKNAFAKHSVK